MALFSWQLWSAVLLGFTLCTPVFSGSPSFENTAVVRTIELDGALTHVTTRYSVRALADEVKEYTFALGKEDGDLTTWAEARLKGDEDTLPLKENGLDKNG
jgi:oligosaccharyltransferase complex subunit alpha (ribophorin I)